jgi:hypothetical protein
VLNVEKRLEIARLKVLPWSRKDSRPRNKILWPA